VIVTGRGMSHEASNLAVADSEAVIVMSGVMHYIDLLQEVAINDC
jgi:hypothetical protein